MILPVENSTERTSVHAGRKRSRSSAACCAAKAVATTSINNQETHK